MVITMTKDFGDFFIIVSKKKVFLENYIKVHHYKSIKFQSLFRLMSGIY